MDEGTIETLMMCMKGTAAMFVKDGGLRQGRQVISNAILMSIGLDESWDKPLTYCHVFFYSRGNTVDVLGCFSINEMPDTNDVFHYWAGHDSDWFDEGTYHLKKILAESSYRRVGAFATRLFSIGWDEYERKREQNAEIRLFIHE